MADIVILQEKLGIHLNEPSLLRQALVHSSLVNENLNSALVSNERLEFLGDAVLDVVFAEKLYRDLPDASEGDMTKLRSYLVRRDTLAGVARGIGLGEHIFLGRGEEVSGGRDKSSNLADALEAVIAAVFLDQGLEASRAFILRLFNTELERLASQRIVVDYKSQLQQLFQARRQQTPVYHIIEATGKEHEPRFTAEVRVGTTVLGRGCGKSKKQAEVEAARSALEQLPDNFT